MDRIDWMNKGSLRLTPESESALISTVFDGRSLTDSMRIAIAKMITNQTMSEEERQLLLSFAESNGLTAWEYT